MRPNEMYNRQSLDKQSIGDTEALCEERAVTIAEELAETHEVLNDILSELITMETLLYGSLDSCREIDGCNPQCMGENAAMNRSLAYEIKHRLGHIHRRLG